MGIFNVMDSGECDECGRPDNDLTDRGQRFLKNLIGGSIVFTGVAFVLGSVANASQGQTLISMWIGGELLLVPVSYVLSGKSED